MKTFKIILHSSVDLITNSSTVIFTYSNGSIGAIRSLINEMLKVFGNEDKTFDDLFYADIFLSKNYYYYDGEFDFPEDVTDRDAFINDIKIKVLKGEIEKPKWMVKAEESNTHFEYFSYPSNLELLPKDKKYNELANKLLKYLYSTDHEATRDG